MNWIVQGPAFAARYCHESNEDFLICTSQAVVQDCYYQINAIHEIAAIEMQAYFVPNQGETTLFADHLYAIVSLPDWFLDYFEGQWTRLESDGHLTLVLQVGDGTQSFKAHIMSSPWNITALANHIKTDRHGNNLYPDDVILFVQHGGSDAPSALFTDRDNAELGRDADVRNITRPLALFFSLFLAYPSYSQHC